MGGDFEQIRIKAFETQDVEVFVLLGHPVGLLDGFQAAEVDKAGGISEKVATRIAQAIRTSNPKHITANIISRFIEIIRHQETQ